VSYLLDTNICSAYVRGHRRVGQKFLQFGGILHVSSVTVGELLTWFSLRRTSARWQTGIRDSLTLYTVLDVTPAVAEVFGKLNAHLLDAGRSTPGLDLLIAATALAHDFTLVTQNTADFAHIPNLRLDDWLVS
jgi:tRNA(fMet)-specific endonuclease VapC